MANISIWPGSSSFFPGDTPFGFYDSDNAFSQDADKVADWCAKRLGYPLVDIELQAIKDSNGKWDKMSKEERLNSMNRVIDQNPDIIDQAYLNGGVNMMLDNISNVFLIGKVAKQSLDLCLLVD